MYSSAKKKKEEERKTRATKKYKHTTTIFNVFTIASNENLTRLNFILMTIYTHDSSTLVHVLNLISVLDFKFTLSIYNNNSTRYSELQIYTKGV
jgi:hypothetical protein